MPTREPSNIALTAHPDALVFARRPPGPAHEHSAHIPQEDAGIPAGLQSRLRYGIPALDEQEKTPDHLTLPGHVARVNKDHPQRFRAEPPPHPEWEMETEQQAPGMRRSMTWGGGTPKNCS